MFTDVVGSSRMMARDEAHALDLLEEHNSIIRQSIEKHDGYIIKLGCLCSCQWNLFYKDTGR